MTLFYENECCEDFCPDFDANELANQILNEFLDFVDCPYESEVSLMIVDDETIRAINKDMRNMDKSTDVLSFPMNDYPEPGDFSEIEETPDAFHPESGELLLGDIVISYEHLKNQAVEYGHSMKREFAFLMVHSLLHLIGYDHMEEEERILMEKKQKEFLNNIGITRES